MTYGRVQYIAILRKVKDSALRYYYYYLNAEKNTSQGATVTNWSKFWVNEKKKQALSRSKQSLIKSSQADGRRHSPLHVGFNEE